MEVDGWNLDGVVHEDVDDLLDEGAKVSVVTAAGDTEEATVAQLYCDVVGCELDAWTDRGRTGRTEDGRCFIRLEGDGLEGDVRVFDTDGELADFLWEEASCEGGDAVSLMLLFRMGMLRLRRP